MKSIVFVVSVLVAQITCTFTPRPGEVEFNIGKSIGSTLMHSVNPEQLQNLADDLTPVEHSLGKLLRTVNRVANRQDVGDPYDALYSDLSQSYDAAACLLTTVDHIVRESGHTMMLEFLKEIAYHPMVNVMQIIETSTSVLAGQMANFKLILNLLN